MDMTKLSDSDLQALAAGDMQAVSDSGLRALAGEQTARDEWKQTISVPPPVADSMTTGERVLAGVGKGMTDVYRGAKQTLNIGDQDELRREIEESRRLDAPLMNTTAGMAGNIGGNIAALVPAAFIPGANTVAGGTAIGAASGLLTPTLSTEEAAKNAALGGVAGPAGIWAGRGLSAGVGTLRGLIEPLSASGQERIAQRVYAGFAGGGDEARQAAANIRSAPDLGIPGYQPTSAEVANNPGLAQLQRTLLANPDVKTQIAGRAQSNRDALLNSLLGIAGDEQQMAQAVAARKAASDPLYAASRAQNILPDAEFMKLAQRPAMQNAMKRAESLMSESGQTASPGEFMHSVKMALDDMLETAPQQGIGGAEEKAIAKTRAEFIKWLEAASPEYGQGRAAFSKASQPINQMQFGQELVSRFQPALAEFGDDTTITSANYARALVDADKTARKATGFKGATASGLLTPEAQSTVTNVGTALGRKAKAEKLGRGPGSPTAENLISQNFIQQVAGPLGMPQSLGQNVLAQTLSRPIQWAGRLAEPRVIQRLAEIGLNPQEAAEILSRSADPDLALQALLNRQQYLAPAAAGGLLAVQAK